MEWSGFASDAKMPGFDTLSESLNNPNHTPINTEALIPFQALEASHKTYLENEVYHRYLRMHKVALGVSGAKELQVIGRQLENESAPLYLDAAAWAYAEAGLTDTSIGAVERVAAVTRAEELWMQALQTNIALQADGEMEFFDDPVDSYRYALPLAFSPLMKSIIVGNVTPAIRQQALKDTISFAAASAEEIEQYFAAGDVSKASTFVGLLHELNALATLLYLDDPRYIPMPSTARADTGYYHREQTHDIMVINQHWGKIQKIIPIEIKSKASGRDRRRYKALLVRGKMHLAVRGHNPIETARSYQSLLEGTASIDDMVDTERMATDLREMLRLYQQGYTPQSLAVKSLTRFHKSASLEKAHPEIAP